MGKHKVDPETYEIYMQTEPIPFGKYPKAKYELEMCRVRFSFTTTVHSHEECLKILFDKIAHYDPGRKWNTYRIYKTQHGTRTLIAKSFYDEESGILPEEHLEIRTEEKKFERAAW